MGRGMRLGLRSLVLGMVVLAGTVGLAYGVAHWRARRSVEHGIQLLSAGDYASAARTLLRAVEAEPGDARGHYYLGLAYAHIGVSEGALNQFRDAVQLAPGDARFHDALAQAYRDRGQTRSALSESDEALRRQPREARYEVHAAGALLDEGRTAEAIERLRRAVDMRPKAADMHLLLADTLRRTGDVDGMMREYCEVARLAGWTALGEMARQEIKIVQSDAFRCPGAP